MTGRAQLAIGNPASDQPFFADFILLLRKLAEMLTLIPLQSQKDRS
jgi:hypothetical protein